MSTIVYRLTVLIHDAPEDAYTIVFRSKAEREDEIRFLKREMTGMKYTLAKSILRDGKMEVNA